MNNINDFIQNEEGIQAIEFAWISAFITLMASAMLGIIFLSH